VSQLDDPEFWKKIGAIARFHAQAHLSNSHDVEDIVQTIREKVWVHRASLDMDQPWAWVHVVAKNAVIDILRKRSRERIEEPAEAIAPGSLEDRAVLEQLERDAIQRLNEPLPTIWALKRQGFPDKEIAAQLKLGHGYVRNLLSFIRTFIREFINPEEDE